MSLPSALLADPPSSFTDRQKDYPKYLPGLGATIGCQVSIMIILALLSFHFSKKNKAADEHGEHIEGNPKFRYTI
jgi:hypothetical protein